MKFRAWASVAVCIVVALTGCTSSAKAAKDVNISSCTASPTGGRPKAAGQILNHSSKASLYAIHVQFEDSAGNKVGDGVAAVAKVDSGTRASWHVTGSLNAKGPVKCSLSSVTRSSVP